MSSSLLVGKVRHRRIRPRAYALEHSVYYFALDLAELDRVIGSLRLVSRNRRNIVAFRDADHLPVPATDIDAAIRAHLRDRGINAAGWQVTLVTSLRVLGYVFNPASFYLCRDPSGVLRVVVVEVHNTFGERHLYTLQPERDGAAFVASMDKAFYVSPFIDMEARYTVQVRDGEAGLRIAIEERQAGEPLLITSLVLERIPLTDATLGWLLLRHPLVTHKTIGMIHWHALRLWLRGIRFRRHHPVAS
jgi:uncharacterized protein